MKNYSLVIIIFSIILIVFIISCATDAIIIPDENQETSSTSSSGNTGSSGGSTELWSMGYYASWLAGMYPVSEIEWSGLTHIAISFYVPNTDGTLTLLGNNPSKISNIITNAKAKGVKTIASIGGSYTGAAFRAATSAGVIDNFVSNLVNLMNTFGFDGFDIDWEPLEFADEPVVIDLANRIRSACSNVILTIAIGYLNTNLTYNLTNYDNIAAVYDQMNIMSYQMAGAWSGWKSWHSSPLYSNDRATPTSIDSTIKLYTQANVPASKLGVGIGFYGIGYSPPVTGPGQQLNGSTVVAGDQTLSYVNIMKNYFSESAYNWDSLARVPYLSWATAQSPDGCSYISYEDDRSIEEKGNYIKANGLGGVIIWELNEGYDSSAQSGMRSPLLLSIRDHILK